MGVSYCKFMTSINYVPHVHFYQEETGTKVNLAESETFHNYFSLHRWSNQHSKMKGKPIVIPFQPQNL